jgi:hypothetical protein
VRCRRTPYNSGSDQPSAISRQPSAISDPL